LPRFNLKARHNSHTEIFNKRFNSIFVMVQINVVHTETVSTETTEARKLNLKIPLDVVKYPLWVEKNILYDTT